MIKLKLIGSRTFGEISISNYLFILKSREKDHQFHRETSLSLNEILYRAAFSFRYFKGGLIAKIVQNYDYIYVFSA